MGGTDVAASFSGSSSAASGTQVDQKSTFGDFIIGGSGGASISKPSPPWLWLGLAALAMVAVTVWLVRK